MMRAAAFAAVAITVTACGGGSSSPQMRITPAFDKDPPRSLAAAVNEDPVTARGVSAQFDSPSDAHYFPIQATQPGTLTLRTEGANTRIDAFTLDGEPLEGIRGSLIVTITPQIASEDGAIISRITPAPGGDIGAYTLRPTIMAGTGTTTPPT